MRWLAAVLMLTALPWGPGRPAAAGGPGEARLLVLPPQVHLEIRDLESRRATAEVQVQVLAPPRRPWRLLLQAQGPPVALEGKPLAALPGRWQGRPVTLFREGSLDLAGPQVVAQGQGPASGLLRVEIALPDEAGAGRWRQRLLLLLESP